ncbi:MULTISPECIES: type II toxin-antitoxin system Rv0910 family toxin [Gordonia]|uniref:SRPBCC family protein n=1 Tax=Gordonia amicalis TaxID=89053 RepID=A0AAE4R4P3_9ACTN|nr:MULTISPECIES: SRPBCC family protein [Gordonia]ATD69925.1 SRPBCC family protein [Gordonia sp. 1D]MCR8897829.1 SRPBCC family protein [Gordonia sp. GONU]MCZ0911990.1 SRPBCC family protein [Gordonia amicalis]MCZ4651885.1 SRPBCC family protein [Gordonia amicalis]MDJ0453975.1 SRPBCC family protein [Gordonia amicalis]
MAKTSDSIEVELSPEDTWAAASDLGRYSEWLLIHETWRSPIPAAGELRTGIEIASIVRVKGTRVRFDWVIEKFDPVSHVRLKGSGKGGVKAKLDLGIIPTSRGSEVTFTVDLGGLPLIGPVGKTAVLAVSGDLRKSLQQFREVFG